jgi:hypothetical protein
MAPFLALITPVEQGGGQPPGGGQPGVPTHPIYNPPYPSHPWVPPSGSEGPPVPGWPNVPGNWPGLPGQPQPPLGIWGPPQMPPGFWGGGMGPGVKPQPPFPGQGPVDPGYSPPWAQVPPGGGQGGGPVDPGYSPPWAQVPPGQGPGGGRPPGPPNLPEGGGVVIPIPPDSTAPIPPPPEGTPPENKPYVVWFGPGSVASVVYLPPTATTKPPSTEPIPTPQ